MGDILWLNNNYFHKLSTMYSPMQILDNIQKISRLQEGGHLGMLSLEQSQVYNSGYLTNDRQSNQVTFNKMSGGETTQAGPWYLKTETSQSHDC